MKVENLKDLLYKKFGAYSKNAYHILNIAVKQKMETIHELVNESGYSFRFVREIIYALESEFNLQEGKLNISDALSKLLNIEEENNILDFFDAEQFIKKITTIVENYTKHNSDLDHISAVPETCYERANFLVENFDTERCNILFVGDHDLSSISLALLSQRYNLKYNLFVVDIDDNVLSYIQEISDKFGLSIVTSHSDFRYSIPNIYYGMMDIVFTDPPYTPEGMGVFLNRSIQCMKNNEFSTLCISYKAADMSNMLGVSVQKEIIKRDLYIDQIISNFNKYYAAEALGYRSDLYICRITPSSIKNLDRYKYTSHIYTHGINSVESERNKIDLNELIVSIDFSKERKFDEYPIYLIDGNKSINYSGAYRINKLTLRRFIESTLEGKLNINKNGLVIFNCTEFSKSYDFRPLLLSRFNEYYCLFTKGQEKHLRKSGIITFIGHGYEMEKITVESDISLYRFKQKLNIIEKGEKLAFLMLLNARSGLKNSFVKAMTTIEDINKNGARKLYDSFSLDNEQKMLLFNLPLQSLNKLHFKIMTLID